MIGLKLPQFYPVLDTALLARHGIPLTEAVEAILEGGARILQLRHKGHFSRSMFDDSQTVAKLCDAAGAAFVINDRPDIAVLVDAGLHLGQDDLPPRAARRILGPEQPLGFSTHNEIQLHRAIEEPVDYLALGPIFMTRSKQNPDPVVGLQELQRLRPKVNKPLV